MGIVSQAKGFISSVEGSSEGKYGQKIEFDHKYFPLNIGEEKFTNTIIFEAGRAKYENNEVTVETKKDTNSKVELYMPQDIQEENSRDWSESEVGQMGQQVAKKAANTSLSQLDSIKSATDFLKEAGGDIGQGLKNQAGKGLYNLLGQAVGSEEAASAALARQGKAVDPKLEMLFQGLGFREFSFDFSMYPKTEKEAEMIIDIVNLFKYRSAPGLDTSKFYFTWPDIFKIKFKNSDYLFNFEPSALTSVSVNYTPEGIWAEMKNGSPVGVQLSLSFTELNILTRDKLEKPG